MNGKNINFDDRKIKKTELYKNKKIFNIDDIDVNKILVSKKEPYSKNNSLILLYILLLFLLDIMIMMLLDHYV